MEKREEEFLKTQDRFRTDAIHFIKLMLEMCNKTPGSKHLVDEMIHSIFFLGKIHTPSYPPEAIITDTEMYDALKAKYPRPFDYYQKKLPRRSPFSCVLDMIVLQEKPENEDRIKERLRKLLNDLKPQFLFSSTICISQRSQDSIKRYGVSMSTSRCNPGRILIAASCFSYWDDYVAGAVMTYYPEKVKKSYFDGTIKLPDSVTCNAFNIKNGEHMNPCRSCGNLYGLKTSETKQWAYGHCAEAESVSNLLKNEEQVKNQARPTSHTFTPENRKKAEDDALKNLKGMLRMIHFNTWDGSCYNPQTE